jgi:Ca2+-binding RTX toxin-like protein
VAGTAAIDLTGNSLANDLSGNAGVNILNGKEGVDTMRGYGGNDKYYVDDANDVVIEEAGGGTSDQVVTYVDYVLAANVEILTTNFTAGTVAIDLTGNSLANDIRGNAGSNVVDGKGGSDTLRGYGGNDTFVFDTALGAANIDTVIDFSVADDTIRLDNAIFTAIAGTGVLTLAQFAANAGGTAQDASDRIIYETDTGKLFYDSNGSAAGGVTQFATLSSGLALTNADFTIV